MPACLNALFKPHERRPKPLRRDRMSPKMETDIASPCSNQIMVVILKVRGLRPAVIHPARMHHQAILFGAVRRDVADCQAAQTLSQHKRV